MREHATKANAAFEARLAREAAVARERAESMPPGTERDQLLRLAQQCDTAVEINAWLTSPASHPPAKLMETVHFLRSGANGRRSR
jgi:hypothetical protein